jgi:hypothetical protein
MADTEFTIEVQAEGIGTDATGAQITALGDRIEAADKVVTRFDRALEVAGARLAEQADAASRASAALGEAEDKYKRLERAAGQAAKRVEKAANAGKDTTQLQAAADAAAAAVREQAQAVDRAAAEATAAAAAQEKLAKAYRSVEKAADRAAEETRGTERSFGDLFGAAGALGGPLGGLAGQISGIGDGLRAGGGKAGLILGAFAAGNAFIVWTKAAIGLSLALVGVVGGLLAFAAAADEATSKKLEKAWDRAGKRVKKLFEGVKTEKLVRPVRSLLRLLDDNTSAGKGLATIFETLLNPIIDGLDRGEPMVKEFFKGMILGALRAIIVVLKLRNAVAKAIPKETREKIKAVAEEILGLKSAATLGEESFKVLAIVVAALLIPLALVAAGFLAIGLVIYGMVLAIQNAVAILGALAEALDKATDPANVERNVNKIEGKMRDLGSVGGETGKNIVDGLINGLKNGQGPVAGVAAALAKAAIDAIKGATQSSSPSRVMIRFGEDDFAGGMVIGLRRGQPDVEDAGRGLGRSAIEGTQSMQPAGQLTPARQGGGSGGAQVTVAISPNGIVVQAPSGDGESIAQEIRRVLLAEVEGAIVQSGAGELAAGTT